jgi:hypothetical protein
MNLSELVTWGGDVRQFLDRPISPDGQPINLGKLNITFGWLRQYDEALAGWRSLLHTAEAALDYIRLAGYHAQASRELAERLDPLAALPAARRLADSVVEFVADQSTRAAPGERLPASSEVLESLIGKGKRLEGQQSRSGFTKMVLGMAAAVTVPTQEFIQRAFAAVKTHDVITWAREKLGASLQSRRRAAFKPVASGTEPAQNPP